MNFNSLLGLYSQVCSAADDQKTASWIHDKLVRFRSTQTSMAGACAFRLAGLPEGDIEDFIIFPSGASRGGNELSMLVDFTKIDPSDISASTSGFNSRIDDSAGGLAIEISTGAAAFTYFGELRASGVAVGGKLEFALNRLRPGAKDGEIYWRDRLIKAFRQLATECKVQQLDDSRFD